MELRRDYDAKDVCAVSQEAKQKMNALTPGALIA